MTQKQSIPRWRTAISRQALSKPSKLALAFGLYSRAGTVLDYGCGRGFDVAALRKEGFDVKAWDPYFFPDNPKTKADTVNLGYVLNVIEDKAERAAVLKEAFALAQKCLIVSVRPSDEAAGLTAATPQGDGVITKTGTFQKFFGQDELGAYIGKTTGAHPYLVDTGVAVVFKDPKAEAAFVSAWAAKHHGKSIKPY